MITQHDFKLLNNITQELIEFIYDNEESFKDTFCAPENSQIRGVHLAGIHLCISLISLEYIITEVYIGMADVSEWYEQLNK